MRWSAWIIAAAIAITGCSGAENAGPTLTSVAPDTDTATTVDSDEAEGEAAGESAEAQPFLDDTIPWLSADADGVFVEGLTAARIQADTGFDVGEITIETGENLEGPTISFADGDALVQLVRTTITFDDMVASQPEAEIEVVGDFDVLVIGGLGAIIDFPEGPVTVSSFDFSQPTSGVDLARLIALARSAT